MNSTVLVEHCSMWVESGDTLYIPLAGGKNRRLVHTWISGKSEFSLDYSVNLLSQYDALIYYASLRFITWFFAICGPSDLPSIECIKLNSTVLIEYCRMRLQATLFDVDTYDIWVDKERAVWSNCGFSVDRVSNEALRWNFHHQWHNYMHVFRTWFFTIEFHLFFDCIIEKIWEFTQTILQR